ncbi:carbon-nitrogen hydrolase family protein [Pseudochryseolinea flava]|uniref:Carbon-nitrogen hydrolase family protein n=1 Tax=Pseudochryseolinea flava TaxID=2059302 RepID=A0A364XXF9_9BACT|nr:carbon-nitrogen hydrolase family protein [Pseudochryseolinea flava]RAV98945.1 carbon-nitrogen hydrolase family protein [Pseudochryseolinea flava]
MKLSVAQLKPVPGEIQRNIETHVKLIDMAIADQADLIIFPELSLTGYEPSRARELAVRADDARLQIFQKISDGKNIVIGVGAPIKSSGGVEISLLFFRPRMVPMIYAKHYLHADEEPFFVRGDNTDGIDIHGERVALAICYEISIAEHTQKALVSGAQVFVASVAKTERGITKAHQQLSEIAKAFSVSVLMSNAVGPSEDGICAGASAVFAADGSLMTQLGTDQDGTITFDSITKTHTLRQTIVPSIL